jgi:hypothetical protein
MVAVQMRYEDGFDRIRLDAKASYGNHRRDTAVNQELGRLGDYVKARVESAAAAEGVATTEELQSHWGTSRSKVQMASRLALDRLQRRGDTRVNNHNMMIDRKGRV